MMIHKFLKTMLTLGMLFAIVGCVGTNSDYYILSISSQPSKIYANKNKTIGVEKIIVPAYMYKREIAIAESSNKITLLGNAKWGEDIDEGLTNRLIGYLQKKFNQPNVYTYPWGTEKQPNIKISIQISRFIKLGDKVYLDATWSMIDLKTKKNISKLFSISVETKSDLPSIVSSMDRAFIAFEESIAREIKQL